MDNTGAGETLGLPAAMRTGSRMSGLRSIAPMMAATVILCAGNGLLTTVVGLSLVRSGIGEAAIRPIVTGYPLGFLLGCLTARELIVRLAHAPAFAVLALLTALATVGFALPFHPWHWAALRVVNGFCIAGAFTIVESWVNLNAGWRDRGLLLAGYMVSTSLGLSVGQAMLSLAPFGGSRLFWIAATTLCVSPVALAFGRCRPARVPTSRRAQHKPMRFRAFLLVAPLAILAATQAGMTNLNFLTVAPIYGAMIGLKASEIGSLVIAFSLGGLCVQPGIGWLSDRLDRRAVLAVMAGLSAALCGIVATSGTLPLGLLLMVLFAYGASTLAIYPLALALAASRVDPSFIVSMSGKFLLVYSFGSVVAPAISTALMERFSPPAMFAFLGCLAATVALCSLVAFLTRKGRHLAKVMPDGSSSLP